MKICVRLPLAFMCFRCRIARWRHHLLIQEGKQLVQLLQVHALMIWDDGCKLRLQRRVDLIHTSRSSRLVRDGKQRGVQPVQGGGVQQLQVFDGTQAPWRRLKMAQ